MEDAVVVLAGGVGRDLVEGVVADRRVVHLVGCVGAYEGAAAVREGVVRDDEVVVRSGAEVDEVGARRAVFDDVAVEDQVLDVRCSLAGVVVHGLGPVQVTVEDGDGVGYGPRGLVFDEHGCAVADELESAQDHAAADLAAEGEAGRDGGLLSVLDLAFEPERGGEFERTYGVRSVAVGEGYVGLAGVDGVQ